MLRIAHVLRATTEQYYPYESLVLGCYAKGNWYDDGQFLGASMRKLKTQFAAIVGDRARVAANCSSCTSCCCCTVLSTTIFSIATSRYLLVKAREFKQNHNSNLESPWVYGLYGFLFYIIGLIFGPMLFMVTALGGDLSAAVAISFVGMAVFLYMSYRIFSSVGVKLSLFNFIIISYIIIASAEMAIVLNMR